ncbi:MAG: SdrD B-like domain-containing protein [Blastocatellia bacterium]
MALSGTISGTVFRDFNADGVQNSVTAEIGVGGITVTAYDSAGVVRGSATSFAYQCIGAGNPHASCTGVGTPAIGSYSISATGTGPYRVEFTTLPSGSFSGPIGTDSSSTIQFVPDGNSSNVDLGINYSEDYSEANPNWIISCFTNGVPTHSSNSGSTALAQFPYNSALGGSGQDSPAPGYVNAGTMETMGPVWATAWNRQTQTIYAGALLKRHSGLGPNGIGAIYQKSFSGAANSATLFYDFGTAAGNDVASNATRFPGSGTAFGQEGPCATCDNVDPTVFGQIGKRGIGGIDVTDHGNTLYAVNLFDRKVYSIDTDTPAPGSATEVPNQPWLVSSPCTNGTARPWAVQHYRGKLYIGVVCDAASSATAPDNPNSDLTAHMYSYDGSTWSHPINGLPLNYNRTLWATGSNYPVKWIDTFAGMQSFIRNVVDPQFQQPILSTIDFDVDGSVLLGFMDRSTMQLGYQAPAPDEAFSSTSVAYFSKGDYLRAYFNPVSQTFVLENNGVVGPLTTNSAKANTGPGGLAFYWGDHWSRGTRSSDAGLGGAAIRLGSGEAMMTLSDVISAYAAGISHASNTNGAPTKWLEVYQSSSAGTDANFAKAGGLGDITLLPGNAPIEIGNRIWMDAVANGVQDSGEMGLSGVVVRLFDFSNTQIGMATTDSNGNYLFSNASGTDVLGKDYNVTGLTENVTGYQIRVDVTQGGNLAGKTLSQANNDATANGDSRDSDATLTGNNAIITFNTAGVGANDHTYDLGFSALSCTVAGATTVCNSTVNTYSVTTSPATLTNPTYSWSVSNAGGANASITGASNGSTVMVNSGTNSGAYTVMVSITSTEGNTSCSLTVTINNVTAGVVATDQTVCSPGDPAAFTVPTAATGSGTLTYQWQSSTTDCTTGFNNIAGATSATYDPPSGLTQTTYYRRITTSTLNTVDCAATSNCITVTVNNVTAGTVAGDQALCGPADPVAFTVPTAATGSGTLSYQWQSSTTDCTTGFNNIGGATSATYDAPSGLTQTTYYRRIATSTLNGQACAAAPSNCITVTVNNVTAGTVAGDQTLCSPGDPAAFTVPTVATGSGTLTYQWQSSTTDCTTGFNNIAGATSATYDAPSGLTQTTYYRRIVTSMLGGQPCTATSNCITVAINDVTAGAVGGDQAVCSPGDPAAFTAPTAATGSGTLSYQWQSSTTDCTTGFNNIAGATGATYDPPSGLTQTTYYRRIATSTLNGVACAAAPSNCITVTFSAGPTANAGTDQELCLAVSGTTSFNLTGTGTNGTISWAVQGATGTAAATVANGTTLTPTVNVTGVGTVTVRLTMTSNAVPSCGTATDDVVLTVGAMNLGNVVWKDLDNDGVRDTAPAEPVIDGVLLNLYRESNATPGLQIPGDTLVTSQTTAGGGLYNFTSLPCADYYVQAAASNFAASGALFGCASSTGNVTGNSDQNDRDHGVDNANPATNGIASSVISLTLHGEPTNDGDGNDGNLTADFGFAPLMNLGNLVWKDLDADGVRDTASPNEPGVDGVKVVLWLDNGDNTFNSGADTMVAMQNTAGGGLYNFTGLLPGNYFVQIDSTNFGAGVLSACLSSPNHDTGDATDNNDNGVDNPTPTTGGVVSVLIPLIGQSEPTNDGDGNNGNLTVDFGFYAPMNLGNLVWKDLDGDGIRDTVSPNELGVDGVKVVLWRDNGDNTFSSGTDTMVTMQNTSGGGAYNFTGLLPGNYFVQIDSTNFGAGVLSTCLSSPGNDSGDATDNNDNGVDNPTPTAGGVISVLIPLLSQSEPTNDGDGNNGNLTVDFGFYAPMNLGNLVWKDLDADGVRDTVSPNEPGVDGVKVVLWRDNGDNTFSSTTDTMVAMQNTSGGGTYNFTGLLPGNYFVQVDSTNFGGGVLSTCLSSPNHDTGDATDNNDNGVDNPTPTTGGVVSVLIPLIGQSEPTNDGDGNNGNLTVDFGFYPPMSLGNLVWKDLDGDGIRDTVSPNEPGVDGVKVVLWRDNGDNTFSSTTDTMLAMQNTSGGGAYNFTGLLPGTYFVQIDATNFGAGVLSACLSSPGADSGDTDNNDNGVDNPTPATSGIVSTPVVLIGQSEPTDDGDGNNGNQTVDFGFYPPMNLGNLVWKDLDGDGVRDTATPNEPGVDGVKVVLWRDNGDNTFNSGTDTMVTMQNTAGGGLYNFTGLLPGNYFVQIDSTNFGAGVLSACLSSPGNENGDTVDNNDNGVDNPTPTTGGVLSVLIPLIGTTEPTDDGDGNNGNLTVDFGFYPPMNLGNLVWKDLDGDGIRDTASPNEPGVDGVKVVLWRDNGDNTFNSGADTMVTMQNTSGGGAYNFTGLLPGNYFVQIDSTNFGAGVLSTCLSSPNHDTGDVTDNNDNGVDNPTPTTGGVVSVLIPLIGQSEPTNDGDGNNGNLTVDFGFYPPMNLGNLVWKDLDADGIRDTVSPNEPGVDGVKVVLWRDNGDNTFSSTTDTMVTMQNTSGGGAYNFTNLLPGNYFVQIDQSNFGAGVLSVCLSSPGNDSGDATDNNDNGVDNPTPATGGVVSVLIPLVGSSEPTNDGDGNNGNLTVDFGFYPPMNLGNLVWKDLDADGIRDTVSPNEPGVDGVKVVLWRDNGDNTFSSTTDTMTAMQNTSGGGAYNFQNLIPGNYFVQIDSTNFGAGVLSACLSSPGNENGDATDNNDNGVDNPTPATSGIVSVLIPLIGQSEPTNDGDGNNGNLTVDFGFYPPMNLGNLVWKDNNANGLRDGNPLEPGVDGVKVVLWRDNGDNTFNSGTDTMVTMQNTSGGGAYNFTNLLPGNYFVQIDQSNFGAGVLSVCLSSPGNDSGDATDNNDNGVDNQTPTTGGVVSVMISLIGQSEPTNDGDGNNGNLTVDFGFYPPMNLGNLVWKDLNGNGVRDGNPLEAGINGVKVVLWRDNGDNTFNSTTDTMVTMANTAGGGLYNFTNLLPGTYFVEIPQTNFGLGQVLDICLSSPGSDTGDTDNNDNGVDNSTPTVGGIVSTPVVLLGNSEPPTGTDGDGVNGNLTIDFGFAPAPDWAFGNNPNGIPGKVYEGDACNGATGTYVLTMTNLGPTAANPGAVMTDVIPNGITPIAASGTGWSCSINGQTVTCTSTAPLPLNAMTQIRITVGIGYNISGPVTNTATIAYPNDPGTNNNSASTTINVVNGIGVPGRPFENNASSVLVYPIHTSSASNPNEQNTRINLTNIHTQKSICVHLFFVDGASCSVADSIICLTPNQTTSFLMSDIDPGTTGYLVAVAIDCNGCPTNFNFLIGDEYVKFASGHKGNIIAEGAAALPTNLQACDANSVSAQLNFDGVSYSRFGRTLALDSFGSRADGNDTMVVIDRIGGNLATGAATLGTLFGILYDDSEVGVSFNVNGACQLRSSLSNNFPRTTPRFETFVPAGRTGWMKFFSQSDFALVGASINYNASSTASAGAFTGAHNLHKLTLSSAGAYVMPVFPAQDCR